jgi:hypothetical protein
MLPPVSFCLVCVVLMLVWHAQGDVAMRLVAEAARATEEKVEKQLSREVFCALSPIAPSSILMRA